MERNIYKKLLEWKKNEIEIPLMIIGARQVGKTYIIKEFCKKEFDRYVYINLLENAELVEIFQRKISIFEKIQLLKAVIKDTQNVDIDFSNTVIFFDEVQESEELISSLKHFNESDIPYKIICAGSLLGVKLKRFHSSFPVGKVRMINMYSMNFEEFLISLLGKDIIDILKEHYEKDEPLVDVMHDKLMFLYRLYLCVGGMPSSINNIIELDKDISKYNKFIIKDIISGYLNDMKKYVTDSTETIRIEHIYKSIPSQIGNKSNKFQFSKVHSGARAKNYETAMQWLLSSNLISKVCLLKTPQIPPEAFKNNEIFKLYLSDVGILNSFLNINFEQIILNREFIYKGEITENYVEHELSMNFDNIYYWKNNNTAEVDFIIYNNDGIIPIEVKAGDTVRSKSLNMYIQQYKPKYAIRISSKNFGFSNNIKSVPLYAAFLIK